MPLRSAFSNWLLARKAVVEVYAGNACFRSLAKGALAHRRELREKQIGKKEEKGQSKAFHGTVKKNLEPPYQEKRHATSEASYDDRRKFASNWEPG
jgi:uncharacterized protein YcaQ